MMHYFNWNECVGNFTPQQSRELASECGVSEETIRWLRDRELIGSCYVEKWSAKCIAFPIHGEDGGVFRAHCRSPKRNNAGKWDWSYEPADQKKRSIPALVVGDLGCAGTVFVAESQWDLISAMDRLDFTDPIDSGQVCLIATRGADIGDRLSDIDWPVAKDTGRNAIYAFPQNDQASRKWLANVIDATGGVHVVEVPSKYKDLNDWTRDGAATAADIQGAINQASFVQNESTNGSEPQPEFAQGHPIAWYADHPINPDDILLGNRYLCRGGGMFIVAPSGLGKSTLSIQISILWCCGLVAFGIKPRKALRILVVQSEDDEGDMTEMAQMIKHLGLTEEQKKAVSKNSELVRCNNLVRSKFIEALRSRLQKARDEGEPFDLIVINPYSVYLGADPKDTVACMEFLNEWLNPILSEFAIGAILIHHTPKTNFQNTDRYKIWDWMYHGAGAAGITNWARAILVIKPETEDLKIFRFIAAKRGQRIGADWNGEFEHYFTWSNLPGVIVWQEASAEQIAKVSVKAGGRRTADLDKVLTQVPVLDAELKTVVIGKIRNVCGVGERPARNALDELIATGKVFNVAIPNPNGRRSFAGVAKTATNI